MPPFQAHRGADDSEYEEPELTREMGLNILKATAIQNTSEFSVPMWALAADESLSQHRPATGLESNFFLREDGRKLQDKIKESVIGEDQRKKVDPRDFAPGGKYRSVVKLSLLFKRNGGDVKMMGTGWLVQDDLLVTAGHCVYDKAYGMGQVKSIVAYLGYQGVNSIAHDRGTSNVEVAYGKTVGTTSGWIRNLGRQYDIAWVRLDRKFKQLGKDNKPINWANTPFQGNNTMLGVVGYPGDMELDGEYGAEMYQCWMPTTYDLAKNNMIQYQIDSYGGQSGSPVFYSLNPANIDMKTNAPYHHVMDLDANSIGVHTYGGAINSGTPLGPYGNPMTKYLNVMMRDMRLTKEIRWVPDIMPEGSVDMPLTSGFDPVIKFRGDAFEVDIPFANEFSFGEILNTSAKALGTSFQSDFEDEELDDENTIEGFFDFLGKAAKTIGNTSIPEVLGPAGVPVSIIAGAAITSIAKAAQKKHSGALHGESDEVLDRKKQLHLAALGEAMFDPCCKHFEVLQTEGIFDTIKRWIPIGVKVARSSRFALSKFAEQADADAQSCNWSAYSWQPQDHVWEWDTKPPNPCFSEVNPVDSLKSALSHGSHYEDFVGCMGGPSDFFPGIDWSALRNFRANPGHRGLSGQAQPNTSNLLTDEMQIITTMKALSGVMILSAIENANPGQLQSLGQEGFFDDITANLKKLLAKHGDSLVAFGPQILDHVSAYAQN